MAIVNFSVVGQPTDYFNNLKLTHIDKLKLLQYIDSKTKIVNGRRKLSGHGVRGWCGVDNEFFFEFSNRSWLNSFRNKLIKDVA